MADVKYIASCSFGKDSLAMVLLLLEKKYPLDEVIFFDTGMEFQAIYNNRDKLSEILLRNNIKFSVLNDKHSFEYNAFQREVHKKDGTIVYGYDWCGGSRRWATAAKLSTINRHYKDNYGDEVVVEYVGVAVDESERIEKYRLKRTKSVKLYPLIEWGMTERDCLNYCYKHGWNWKENEVDLYEILDRVSCYCCANKNQKEIQNIMIYLPEYWERIKAYEQRCGIPYKMKGCQYFEEKLGMIERDEFSKENIANRW